MQEVICTGSSKSRETKVLQHPGMPEGKQSIQPKEVAPKTGEQKLLQRAGEYSPSKRVEKAESGLLEAKQYKQ